MGLTAIMKRLWILAATLSGALASTAGSAAGNPESGAAKAVVCQACHGANGNSVNPEWPSLAGLGADYIAEQLKNFKESKRNNPIMMPNAMSLKDEDMADLGAYRGGPLLLAGRSETLSRRRRCPGHSRVHGLSWTHRIRQ